MRNRKILYRGKFTIVLTCFAAALTCNPLPLEAQPLQVCATVPDLGSLAREVGGEHVAITVFAKPTEDAHFTAPKPSFIKTLHQCEMYIQVGMDLEAGWAPTLLRNARNGKVLPGGRGYLDASVAIEPLEAPSVPIDRSMGDTHPLGNPHYLLDPLNGLRVARLIRDKFSELRPEQAQGFERRYQDFRQRLGTALLGETLYKKYDLEKLATLAKHDRLAMFLQSQGEQALLSGWLGILSPYRGAKVVADHILWPYFAQLFGLNIVEHLEPLPGIPPTTKHLQQVIEVMKTAGVQTVLAVAYYDPRYARFVAENTGATVVPLAHQPGAQPGTDDYLRMMNYNVRQLAMALANNDGKH